VDDEAKVMIVLGVLFFAVIGGIAWGINSYSCTSKWRMSGFQTDYGVIQGCLISKDGKTWIPAENYREIP
jgi:hypothetical protein